MSEKLCSRYVELLHRSEQQPVTIRSGRPAIVLHALVCVHTKFRIMKQNLVQSILEDKPGRTIIVTAMADHLDD